RSIGVRRKDSPDRSLMPGPCIKRHSLAVGFEALLKLRNADPSLAGDGQVRRLVLNDLIETREAQRDIVASRQVADVPLRASGERNDCQPGLASIAYDRSDLFVRTRLDNSLRADTVNYKPPRLVRPEGMLIANDGVQVIEVGKTLPGLNRSEAPNAAFSRDITSRSSSEKIQLM